MTDFDPQSNGVGPEEDSDSPAPVLTAEEASAFEIQVASTFLAGFLDDPTLGPFVQAQVEPLRRTLPFLDMDEAHEAYPLSDAYNARALVQRHRLELRYCPAWKTWLLWNGTHWGRDTTSVVMFWQRLVIQDMRQTLPTLSEEEGKTLESHIRRSLQTSRLEAAMRQAQSFTGISIDPGFLDTEDWVLNCANGTLDLRTGTLAPHHPADLLTKCLAIPYDPSALCPTWDAFLRRIMGAAQGPDSPDMGSGELENRRLADERAQALIDFQQRFVGYALTGDTSEQCLCVLHGSGANGKSTYLETLRAVFGPYAMSTPSASLLAKERADGIPNDVARLRGARLVTAVEIGEGKRLDEELLKRLTGQDAVTARFLHQEFFEFHPTFKLLVACNHLPNIGQADHAIWRRIHRVPFAVTIPEQEQDKDLSAKLQAELPGILAWAVRGCLAWQQHGLGVPDVVRQATADYRSDMDSLGRFLEECCCRVDEARVKAGDLYSAYKTWCTTTGEVAMTMTALGKRLDERGFQKHSSTYVWRLGLGLKDPPRGDRPE